MKKKYVKRDEFKGWDENIYYITIAQSSVFSLSLSLNRQSRVFSVFNLRTKSIRASSFNNIHFVFFENHQEKTKRKRRRVVMRWRNRRSLQLMRRKKNWMEWSRRMKRRRWNNLKKKKNLVYLLYWEERVFGFTTTIDPLPGLILNEI